MGSSLDHLPGWRIALPLGALVVALHLHPNERDVPWPYSPLLGIVGTVLFARLARWEGMSADLWSGLAMAAYFVPALVFGVLWGLGGLVAVGAAFVLEVVTRPEEGRGPLR